MSNIKRTLLILTRSLFAVALLLLLMVGTLQRARAQGFDKDDIKRGREILKIIKESIKENYYDKTFRGVDLDARFKEADEMIKKADSNGQIFGVIAHTLLFLNDSHTYFVPPGRVAHIDYGWQVQMIGDACYIVAVKPGSDAERKGLKAGDTVHFIGGMKPTREDLWKIQYLYGALRPQTRVQLVVQSPGAQPREVSVQSQVFEPGKDDFWAVVFGGKYSSEEESEEEGDAGGEDGEKDKDKEKAKKKEKEKERELKRAPLSAHLFTDLGGDTFIWKMPRFNLTKDEVDEIMKRAANHKSFILDMRGNGGGYQVTMLRLIGHFFDRDVKVGDLIGRKGKKELVAKSVGNKVFKGQLVVLVDSKSGSAAELVARVAQLEKRGVVLGDRTAGAVMEGRRGLYPVFEERVAMIKGTFFSLSVTSADVIMTDGKSLEHTGVTPDTLALPKPEDLAARRDPVLAQALSLVGIKLDAEKAGALFPSMWRR